jgi:hypothetical protein
MITLGQITSIFPQTLRRFTSMMVSRPIFISYGGGNGTS